MDIFDKINQRMGTDLGQFADRLHGYFTFPKLEGELGPHMRFQGKDMLVWSINDYLGLANHPEVRKADAEAAAEYGLAYPMGSRMLTGNTDEHEEFERQAAEFMGFEDTFLLNYGYQGASSIVESLVDRRDVIVYDQLAHACLIDGMRSSGVKRFVYAHNDMAQFENRLQKAQKYVDETGGGILVVTEGVFGMKGDLGKLDEIVRLKERYNFRLFVDDAHGFGVMGNRGQGTGEHFGVTDQIDVLFCTFAKSMALIGAFVCGNQNVVQYMRYNLRSQIYAKSLPVAIVKGALKRLELLKTKPELREQVWSVARALQDGLRKQNFDIGPTQSPVTPVYMLGEPDEAVALATDLRENHRLFVSLVTYPVVERGVIIIRMIPNATHSLEDVERTLEGFQAVRNRLENGEYKTIAEGAN